MFDGEAPRDRGLPGRYWLATTEAPPFAGGIGVYTHQTATMLASGGAAVTVLHHDPEAGDPVCGWRDGYRLIRFSHTGLDKRQIPYANLTGALRISREVGAMAEALVAAEGAPDVVEFQDYGALAWAFLKARLMKRGVSWPRVVLTAHRPHLHCIQTDGDSVHEHRTAFLGELERWCYAAADAVFAPCRHILEPLETMGFPVGRARVVRNPYDPATVARSRPCSELSPEALELSRLRHGPGEPVLVFGKLQAQKGAPDLLAALDALHTEGEAPPVWLFGRDAFLSGTATTSYDALETRHRRLFASARVRYFGGYDLAAMRTLCAGHPVAALPYREDCLPYAFIEAVLCGALPLTSPNGGQAELIPPDLRPSLTADFTRPDEVGRKLGALLGLGPAQRSALSRRLVSAVRAETDPAGVFVKKMEALAGVAPTWRTGDYPFVHAPAKVFHTPDPVRRQRLAASVPQRGETHSVRIAGAAPEPQPDLISVVVPYFDMQAYVEETLASIEAQDHGAVEIVIVDDGSRTVEARAKLEAILAAPRRFPTAVVRKTNGGLADARNAGAKAARGDYLYFLDADDTIHPATLSRSLAVLKRFRNVGYVGAALREFGESEGEWTVFDIDGPYIGFHNLQICAFLVRAEAWLEHGVNDPAMVFGMEDYESHIRMFAAGVRGVALPETLFHYRKRPGSMSKAFEPHAVAYLFRRVLQSNAELFRRFGAELVGLHAENGHGALAPSVCETSPRHAALFLRDIPGLEEVAERLEARASRALLGRALRARCAIGGAEWDYTTGRLLLALDREPAFARSLLRGAARAAPENGWFRLYAMIAELRDGRIGAVEGLWSAAFEPFCAAEAGAVGWVLALEAARGFPQVSSALSGWLKVRVGLDLPARAWSDSAQGFTGPFAELHAALDVLRTDCRERGSAQASVVDAAAQAHLSAEATLALLTRWERNWQAVNDTSPMPGFWSGAAHRYLCAAAGPTAGLDAEELADRARWIQLADQSAEASPLDSLQTLTRRLARRLTSSPKG